jgi:hypothetical protein
MQKLHNCTASSWAPGMKPERRLLVDVLVHNVGFSEDRRAESLSALNWRSGGSDLGLPTRNSGN